MERKSKIKEDNGNREVEVEGGYERGIRKNGWYLPPPLDVAGEELQSIAIHATHFTANNGREECYIDIEDSLDVSSAHAHGGGGDGASAARGGDSLFVVNITTNTEYPSYSGRHRNSGGNCGNNNSHDNGHDDGDIKPTLQQCTCSNLLDDRSEGALADDCPEAGPDDSPSRSLDFDHETYLNDNINSSEASPCGYLKELHDKESEDSRIEELQLDLLECALEYEVKILEMKLKMVQMRSQNDSPCPQLEAQIGMTSKIGTEWGTGAFTPSCNTLMEAGGPLKLAAWRKLIKKLQFQKETLSKEVVHFKKKERAFEAQKRNLEDAMRRVNSLQRKLSKKEEQNVEIQLKEKQAKARLHEIQTSFQRSKERIFEPHKHFIKLIPALKSWLQSLKKTPPIKDNHVQLVKVEQFEAILGRILENIPKTLIKKHGQVESPRSIKNFNKEKSTHDHSLPIDCIKEVYALQKELKRLASKKISKN